MKRYIPPIIALLGTACLAACAATPAPVIATGGTGAVVSPALAPDPLQSLAAFTVADLQAASADAKAQIPPDVTASQCYDYLITAVPTLAPQLPNGQPGTVGAFLAFQKTRDLVHGTVTPNGTLTNLNLACAALATDVRFTIARLAAMGAGVAATGGALAPFAPALPAIGAALPIPLQ